MNKRSPTTVDVVVAGQGRFAAMGWKGCCHPIRSQTLFFIVLLCQVLKIFSILVQLTRIEALCKARGLTHFLYLLKILSHALFSLPTRDDYR